MEVGNGIGGGKMYEDLTEREIQALYWRIAGFSNEEVGETLQMSSNSVRKEVETAFRKLGVRNLVEAFNEGLRREYWFPEDFKFEHLQRR